MKKNTFKFIFDLVMTFLLLLMYKKNLISMSFHEIGGIIACVLFITHILLNGKWVLAVSKKLFSKELSWKLRLSYIVDFLLLIDVTAILVTGLGINKTISSSLAFLSGGGKMLHFFVGGLSIVLVGIHLGLHWNWIKSTVRGKMERKAPKAVSIVCLVLLLAAMGGGVYSLTQVSLGRWLSSPFSTQASSGHNEQGRGMKNMSDSDRPVFEGTEDMKEMMEKNKGDFKEMKGRADFGNGAPEMGKGFNGPGATISAKTIIVYILQFLSIFILFAGISGFLFSLTTKKQKLLTD